MAIEINEDTPTRKITVAKVILSCHQPYEEGHTLDAKEAATLNQTWAENLRNNFAPTVKEALEKAGGLEAVDLTALQREFSSYEAGYEFGASGGREAMDPIMAEAMQQAMKQVRDALKNKGYKLASFPPEKLRQLASSAVERNPAFLENAKAVVAQRESTGRIELDDLSL